MNAPRSNTDAPYVYTGTHLDDQDQAATIRDAEQEGVGKTRVELYSMAEAAHSMATCYFPLTEGREWDADRAMLRAVVFDRLAREAETAAVEVTGYYKCESCSALTKTRHTWHQCPVTGRLELLMVEGLRETGLPLVEPYWPREAELDDRLTAAHEEYERAVLAATPDDDDDVEGWRAFDEIDRAEYRRYSGMVEASHEVRLRYSLEGSR